MNNYSFITTWQLKANIEQVWDLIFNPGDWPQWWPGLKKVNLLDPGDAGGLGAVLEYEFSSSFFYKLHFTMIITRIEAFERIEARAEGDLIGRGSWAFKAEKDRVHVTYTWNVKTVKTWMNVMAPVLRPLFKLNHALVMYHGGKGMAKQLQTRLETVTIVKGSAIY